MKRIAIAVCVGVVAVAGAGCGKGTLGTPSGGGNTGPGPLDGVGGAAVVTGRAGVGGFFATGSGGDGAPAPRGGSSGFAGVGGRAAPGGSTGRAGSGFGGSGFVSCPPPAPPVCGVACGNGLIDMCRAALAPECMLVTEIEECDGDQFGGDSCARLGYGSGKLTCTNICTIDATTCSSCLPIAGRVASCGPAPMNFPYLGTFGIASNDTQVGLGQIDYSNDTGGTRMTFARLDAKLALIGAVGLEDTGQPGPLQNAFIDTVAVAPTPSGWLVAGCGGANIFVHLLDANGKKVARTVVVDGSDGDLTLACLSGTLALAPRPGGGALLTWGTSYADSAAALIAADGLSAGKPWLLADSTVSPIGSPTAAWIGDAFYIALPVQLDSQAYAVVVRLLRVAADGTMTKVADVLKDEFSEAAGFVAGASDIRLIYSGNLPGTAPYDLAVLTRRIGPAGEALSDAVTLGLYPTYFGRAPAVAFGDDTVALLSGYQQELLSVARVDRAGNISSRSDVAVSPDYPPMMYDMVRLGSDVVVGWLRPGSSLMLARVTMP